MPDAELEQEDQNNKGGNDPKNEKNTRDPKLVEQLKDGTIELFGMGIEELVEKYDLSDEQLTQLIEQAEILRDDITKIPEVLSSLGGNVQMIDVLLLSTGHSGIPMLDFSGTDLPPYLQEAYREYIEKCGNITGMARSNMTDHKGLNPLEYQIRDSQREFELEEGEGIPTFGQFLQAYMEKHPNQEPVVVEMDNSNRVYGSDTENDMSNGR